MKTDFKYPAAGKVIHAAVLSAIVLPLMAGNTSSAAPVTENILDRAENFTVRVRSTVKIPFSDDQYGSSRAAAFLVDRERGLLLTNAHVARKSPSRISISFKNSQEIPAEQAYIDTRLDLAILRVDPDRIPEKAAEAKLQCSEKASTGTAVAAFGHPWSLDFTATRGIISGKRYHSDSEFIQTDTPLNPGNSGGALITLDTGDVIGINASVIYSRSSKSEGLGFAVPSSHACRILELFKSGRDPSPPEIPLEFAQDKNLGKNLVVAGILDDLWREKIKLGDSITAVSGKAVTNLTQLETQMRGSDRVTKVTVRRGSKTIDVTLPMKKKPLITKREGVVVSGALFFRSIYADAYQRNIFDLVQVHGVELGSEAERTGFKMYDLVVAINNKPVERLTDIRRLLKPEETNTIIVRRVSRSESRLYDHHILRLKSPKTWMLAFDGKGISGQTVHKENQNRRSEQFAEKK